MVEPLQPDKPKHGIHDWRLFFLVLLVIIGVSFGLFCRYEETRQDVLLILTAAMASAKAMGLPFAFLILTPLLILGLPRLLVYNVAGLVFGFWPGLILAQLSSCLAAVAVYALSCGRQEETPQALLMLQQRAGKFGNTWFVLMARLMPLPGVLLTVGMARLGIGLGAFVAGTFVGYLPHGAPMALIGASIRSESALSGILFGLLSFAAVLFVISRFGPATLLSACGVDVGVSDRDSPPTLGELTTRTWMSARCRAAWGWRRSARYSRVFLRRGWRNAKQGKWALFALAAVTIGAVVWLFPQDRAFHVAWLDVRSRGYDHFWGRVREWGAFTDTLVINSTIFLIGWMFYSRRMRRLALAAFVAACVSGLLCNVVRLNSGRPRPRTWLKAEEKLGPTRTGFYKGLYTEVEGWQRREEETVPDVFTGPSLSANYHSFPSAHTATAMGNGVCMFVACPAVGWIALVNGLLVTWSCFEMRAHYLSDMLASSMLGIAVGVPIAMAYRRIYRRRKRTP